MTTAHLDPVQRMSRDIRAAAETLSHAEARYLVDSYYQMQEDRIRAAGRVRAMSTPTADAEPEPHAVIGWLCDQSDTLETQIKGALDRYTRAQPIGQWLRCAPPDAEVLVEGRKRRKIGDLVSGDSVLSYNRKKASLTSPREVLVGRERYDGLMASIATDGAMARTTMNHKWLIRFNRTDSDANHCVYLMRQGARFKIGRSTIFTKRENGGKDYHRLGILNRATYERADVWMLARFATDYEAGIYEEFASTNWGISQWPLKPSRSKFGDPTHRDAAALDKMHGMLDALRISQSADDCLVAHGLDINDPLFAFSGPNIHRGPTNGLIVTSRNLVNIHDIAQVPVPGLSYSSTPWADVEAIKLDHYSGDVVSLEVAEHHKYVQDGLITCNSIKGIGPVISAGLIANVDIRRANTAGKLWAYCGQVPGQKRERGKKMNYNPALKRLCFIIGESFQRLSSDDDEAVYRKWYDTRKLYEQRKNEAGDYAAQAAQILETKRIGRDTEAFKHYSAGRLPPAHINQRVRRWTTKLFLAHFQAVWYEMETGEKPPLPYAISIAGHADYIPPPN